MQDSEGDSRYHLPPVKDGKPQVLTEQRRIRGDVVATQGERGGIERRSIAEPLEWYVARRHISGIQYEAGVKLHRLWRGSILSERYATMRFGDEPGSYDPESMALMPSDYFRAIESVRGFYPRRDVRMVCLWGIAAGKNLTALRSGLDDLVKHFKIRD